MSQTILYFFFYICFSMPISGHYVLDVNINRCTIVNSFIFCTTFVFVAEILFTFLTKIIATAANTPFVSRALNFLISLIPFWFPRIGVEVFYRVRPSNWISNRLVLIEFNCPEIDGVSLLEKLLLLCFINGLVNILKTCEYSINTEMIWNHCFSIRDKYATIFSSTMK